MDLDFFEQKFQHLVHVSMHGEPEPLDVSTSWNLANLGTPLILEEEFTAPFVLCPPPLLVLMRMAFCDDNKVGKYANQIPNPSSHSSSTCHDSDSMEEIP